jgi:hypothetical protein
MNDVASNISDMYKEKREIQSSNLSRKEKLEQSKILQSAINELMLSAVESAEKFENALSNSNYMYDVNSLSAKSAFKSFTEKQQTSAAQKLTDYYYAKTMSEITGTKHDTKYYLYEAVGAVDVSVYLTEIASIESDKDKNGETIPNSRRDKVHNYIQRLRLTALQKYVLMTLAGYKPTDMGKTQVERYLRSKGFTAKESKAIWD